MRKRSGRPGGMFLPRSASLGEPTEGDCPSLRYCKTDEVLAAAPSPLALLAVTLWLVLGVGTLSNQEVRLCNNGCTLTQAVQPATA